VACRPDTVGGVNRVGVALIVNVCKRTYRKTLEPGWIDAIIRDNIAPISECWVLINNVNDREHAASLARNLVANDELTGFQFVQDVIGRALKTTGMPRRTLQRRGYFLDFGLAVAITGTAPYLVGWDAETALSAPGDWITPGIGLLERDRSLFSVSPRWPASRDTLSEEAISFAPPWTRNFGFSDQAFLVRRADVARPIYRSFAPAALARNFNHPFSFEARVEAHQRASGRTRATHTEISYTTNDLADVIVRTGGYSAREKLVRKLLLLTRAALLRLRWRSPRYRLP